MKTTYLAVQEEENGKYYAFVLKVRAGNNLIRIFNGCGEKDTVTICESKKEAETLCNQWNAGFRLNGIYMFDDPSTNFETVTLLI